MDIKCMSIYTLHVQLSNNQAQNIFPYVKTANFVINLLLNSFPLCANSTNTLWVSHYIREFYQAILYSKFYRDRYLSYMLLKLNDQISYIFTRRCCCYCSLV